MWEWACRRQLPWTTLDIAEATGGSARRVRMIVAAWHGAGLVRRIKPAKQRRVGLIGPRPVSYEVPEAHRDTPAPVMVVRDGNVIGARLTTA